MTKQIDVNYEEIDLLIQNTRYSMSRDSVKLAQIDEEKTPTKYKQIKERIAANNDLVQKLYQTIQ